MRLGWLGAIIAMWLIINSAPTYAEDIEALRAGVVKISSLSEGKRKTGAGFIVKLEPNIAYIVTAAHVVEGDAAPQVEFFTRQNVSVKAEVRKIEGGDPKGLALVVVRGQENLPAGLVSLPLAGSLQLKGGGDQVSAIGFPGGVASWGVLRVNVVSLEGRNIVLSKALEEGNSGGPVIKDNQVVGLVMGLNQGFGLAVPASIVRTVLTNWGVTLVAEQARKRLGELSGDAFADGTASNFPSAGTVIRECPKCPEMVVLPAGQFIMGSPPSEAGREDDEGPPHMVTIAQPFAVGKYEVTFREWDACVAEQACGQAEDEGWGRDLRPVINISYEQAVGYVEWLSETTGKKYRLLSEAEWEYAARAGSDKARFWGSSPDRACQHANVYDLTGKAKYKIDKENFGCDDGYADTAPVGAFKPNAFGLYDMLGNVWEWVEDCYNASYAGAPVDGRTWSTSDCSQRVLRGDSWYGDPRGVRSAERGGGKPSVRDVNVGFRVARKLP